MMMDTSGSGGCPSPAPSPMDSLSFSFQMGFAQESVTTPKSTLNFDQLRQKACQFLEKQFGMRKEPNQIMLFRHCSVGESPLQLLSSVDELKCGTVLEVVLTLDIPVVEGIHKATSQNYMKPTYCTYCGELLMGLAKQGVKCSNCGGNFHERCVLLPQNPCQSGKAKAEYKASGLPHTFIVHTYKKPTICKHCQKLLKGLLHQGLQCHYCKINVHKECASVVPKNCVTKSEEGVVAASNTGEQIQLASIIDGWLLHFTDQNPTWKRQYWQLDAEKITLYQDESKTRRYKTIPLGTILNLRAYDGQPINGQSPPHRFEIQTVVGTYFVAELDWFDATGQSKAAAFAYTALKWLGALQQWMLPPDVFVNQNDATLFPFREKYQLHSFEKLGSGQFGAVFGGVHRASQSEVAIKLIRTDVSLQRRDGRVTMSFLNEIEILRRLDHPGIIALRDVFEFSSAICVVMDKMRADMLSMILSNEKGRLLERVAKFLIAQILQALRYLHDRGIAHRDLKPENVLVSSPETDFPQTKLCDFGYARIIGEATFMKSLVGTPAYVAPEVNEQNEFGYDKSIDMWALGVVVYVTLSGTFPFNTAEDRRDDKINNDHFMFPADLWGSTSPDAIDVIRRLLKTKSQERLKLDECLSHPWLQDPQLITDLRGLETEIGIQYLTSGIGMI